MTLRDKSDIPASVVVELLNTAKVDPFVIFDAKSHEIYMVNPSMSLFWKDPMNRESSSKNISFLPTNRIHCLSKNSLKKG